MPTKQSTRTAIFVVLLLVFAGLLALRGYTLSRSADRQIGFRYGHWQTPEGVLVLEIAPGLPADQGGLRPGDVILALDGAPLADPNHTTYSQIARRFQRGRTVELSVRRAGSILNLRISPGVPAPWEIFLFQALAALCFLGLALLALPPGIAGDLRARLLLGYSFSVACRALFPQDVIGWPWLDFASVSFNYLASGLDVALSLHLASLITGRPPWLRRRPWVIPLYYFICLGSALLGYATYIGERILMIHRLPWTLVQVDVFMGAAGILAELLCVTLLGIQAFRHPEPKGRNQARLVFAASVLTTLSGMVFLVANRFGLVPGDLWRGVIGILIVLGYSAAYFVAIFRYDLFDIERVVRRSLMYTALTTTLVLVFYAAQGAGGILLSRAVGAQGSVWAVALATLLLGLLFVPLRRFLHRMISERLFPERHALRQRLVQLASDLPALGKLPRMGEHLVITLRDLFLTPSLSLLIADPETGLLRRLAATDRESPGQEETPFLLPLEDPAIDHLRRARGPLRIGHLAARSAAFAYRCKDVDPESLIVPLLNQKKLVGALILGPKAVGSYPAEELDLLNLLSHHVAIVIENARLFESATYESLTGLLRREAILEQLEGELERAQRYGRPLSVAVADLDHFKKINDLHGHLVGDTLLRQVAQVIASALRSTDRIGRYGGEEFLLVFPETDIQQAGIVAEKIRALVERAAVPVNGGEAVRATISIGLASLEEVAAREESVSARDLIAAADRALYCAKDRGRNRVHGQIPLLEELVG